MECWLCVVVTRLLLCILTGRLFFVHAFPLLECVSGVLKFCIIFSCFLEQMNRVEAICVTCRTVHNTKPPALTMHLWNVCDTVALIVTVYWSLWIYSILSCNLFSWPTTSREISVQSKISQIVCSSVVLMVRGYPGSVQTGWFSCLFEISVPDAPGQGGGGGGLCFYPATCMRVWRKNFQAVLSSIFLLHKYKWSEKPRHQYFLQPAIFKQCSTIPLGNEDPAIWSF